MGYAVNFFFLVFGSIIFAVGLIALSHFVSRKTPLSYGVSGGFESKLAYLTVRLNRTTSKGQGFYLICLDTQNLLGNGGKHIPEYLFE